jgi:hypothetical protein
VGAVTIITNGVATSSSYGSHTFIPGVVAINSTSISSIASYGTSNITTSYQIIGGGLSSASSYGTHTLIPGAVIITGGGLPSSSAIGTASLRSIYYVSASSISSASGTGLPLLSATYLINANGIASSQSIGTTVLYAIYQITIGTGIPSSEFVSTPYITIGPVLIGVVSIPGGDAYGTPSLYAIAYILTSSIGSALSLGSVRLQLPAIPAQVTSLFVAEPCVATTRVAPCDSLTKQVPMLRSVIKFAAVSSTVEETNTDAEIAFV